MSKNKILFQLSGSIACFKACQVISKLVQDGCEVEVVATRAALAFVGEATLEGLTGRRVHTDAFAAGGVMNHIHLIRWADVVVLCPATANTMAKMASGVGDDLVTTLFLAHDFKKPYLIAPAMNAQMMRHPATQSAMAKLTEWGIEILASGTGALACGEVGEGRLLEPDEILAAIRQKFAATPAQPMRVLITAGGTREPIDGVRAIANSSTGRTGAAISEWFSRQGHDVALLRADGAAQPSLRPSRERTFATFDDLRTLLRAELSENAYDVVIHAAAVSDYSVEGVEVDGRLVSAADRAKLDSNGSVQVRLKRNPKLVDELRANSRNPQVKIVAFKLTNSEREDERLADVAKLAERSRPDFIVHNDLSEIDERSHFARLFATRATGPVRELARVPSKEALASELEKLLTRKGES